MVAPRIVRPSRSESQRGMAPGRVLGAVAVADVDVEEAAEG